ncbi:5-(carboxyamino)imidazole ribonucleotide synthase [Ferrimonas marina]|uniref:N5-carboxyaminoimidazole ribonucleotide synthase n=1 Tax=Ferrimonas marina TaxID=299255 RepID=A0A1M5Z5A2_9GAMM|nr:5-(carboxyamino)imidazole ribonucleotide synthase [Ferrimonas marina]SHI19447.1 5-(carboxyamino)imidazole ribonucleotide synthase [Ferrimonas marina]
MKVGIIGCGQLARMLALAGLPWGLRFSFLALPGEDASPVEGLGTLVTMSEGDSADALYLAMGKPDVLTPEREQLPLSLLRALHRLEPMHPSPDAVAICQHRKREKAFLNGLGLATAPWQSVDAKMDWQQLGNQLGWPLFIKSCEEGYDGKNQWRLKLGDTESPQLQSGQEYLAEGGVAFERELSLIAVRSSFGRMAFYPLTENHHHQGILRCSLAPAANLPRGMQQQAQQMAAKVMEAMGYVGVLTLELFQLEGKLVINELAPRVHNSGHWTQSGSATCQFENHLRAITDRPLASTQAHSHSAMVNLLGVQPPRPELCPDAKVHWYNKALRAGRKQGHLNLSGNDSSAVHGQAQKLVETLYS